MQLERYQDTTASGMALLTSGNCVELFHTKVRQHPATACNAAHMKMVRSGHVYQFPFDGHPF